MDGGVIVEFFGLPRQRAGRAELLVPAGTLGEVLGEVQRACPGLCGLVQPGNVLAPQFLVSIEGTQFVQDMKTFVAAGQKVLLLSADAGG